MKKIIKLLIGIFLLLLVFELVSYLFKDYHDVKYSIKVDKYNYDINEVYKNEKYYIRIENKDYKYSFEIDDYFHKRKRVIKTIYSYKFDDVLCVYPVTKNSDINSTNIMCSDGVNTYSYVSYEKSLKPFVDKLKKLGFNSLSWEDVSVQTKSIDTVSVYQKNISDDMYIFLYKYNGFYSINSNKIEDIKLFNSDFYINHLGVNVGRYYIVPNYDKKYDYDQLYVIDMKNNKVKTRDIKYKISKDSYINGVIDDEVYVFDRDELKQYKIVNKGKKVLEVGNKKDGALYYDLSFKRKDVYSFRDNELVFKTIDDYIKKIEGNTSISFIEKNLDSYYYVTSSNDVYYYNINNGVRVLLFNMKLKDFMFVFDKLFFVSDDSLYYYSQDEGVRKILSYKELEFNWKNRIAIYIE